MSYRHVNGRNNFNPNASDALTACAILNASYITKAGSQLRQLQGQLAATDLSNAATLVNNRTGALQSIGDSLPGATQSELRAL